MQKINETLANLDYMPDSAQIRPKVCAQAMGVSISTFWRLARSKKIKITKLTERTSSVRLGDLREFISASAEG